MLKLEKINVSFQNNVIFDNASFVAYEDDITIVIGESGSGKTTLHDLLSLQKNYDCLYQYNDIHIEELSITDKDDFKKKHLSVVSQFPKLIEDLNVSYHVELCKELYGELYNIDVVTDKLGIHELLDKYPNQLSGGERVRVALLLAFIQNAPIILLDEPTASLDKEYALIVCELLKNYKKNHMIIIFTHDRQVMKYADSLYEITHCHLECKKKGNIKETNIETLKRDYKLKFFKYLLKQKKSKNLFKIFMLVTLSISIGISLFSIQYAEHTSQTVEETLDTLNSQIQVYKPLKNELINYVLMNQQISQSELDEVKTLEDVKDIWPMTIGFRDELLNVNETDDYIIYKDGKVLKSKEFNYIKERDNNLTGIYDISYNDKKNYSQTSDVNVKFDVSEGVYLDYSVLDFLDVKAEELENCEIEFPLYIPIMKVKGIGAFEDVTADRQIHYRTMIRMKIKGLTPRAIGLTFQPGNPVIYYPSSKLEKYTDTIKEYKKKLEGTTIENCPLTDYSSYLYLVEPTSNNKISYLVKDIRDMGLGCESTYMVYSKGFAESVTTAGEQMRDTSSTVLFIILIAYIIMKINSRKEEHSIQLFFQERGFSKHDGRKILLHKWIFDSIFVLIISSLVLFGISIYGETYFSYSYQIDILIMSIMVLFIIFVNIIIPLIIEKRIRDDRT